MKRLLQYTLLVLLFTPGPCASAASDLSGFMVADGVSGRDATTHGWVEQKVYIQSEKDGTGTGASTSGQPAGWFGLKHKSGLFRGGDYTLFTLAYDGIPAFDYRAHSSIPDGTNGVDLQFKTVAEYSVMYNEHWTDWDKAPWVEGTDFYQTFTASGRHVTRIATKLADKTPAYTDLVLNYAIYKTNNGAPSTWERISPVRNRFISAHTDPIIHIFCVTYRSEEVVLVPGQRYAVRFWRDESSQSEKFVIVARKDNGTGFAGGQLFRGDESLPEYDVYAYVSGGALGTVVNHAPTGNFEFKEFLGWNTRFGQTFKATGNGLAAVDTVYARQGGQPFDIPVTFQLYDKPDGKPIGKAKTVIGVPGSFQARAAAFWAKGETPLEPGQTYYIEGKSEGLNVWKSNEDMPGGDGYIDGVSKAPADMVLSIAEYEK